MRVCFVGYPAVDTEQKRAETRQHGAGPNNWIRSLDDAQLDALIAEMRDYSADLRGACARHALPYVDASTDYLAAVEQVYTTLTSA